MSALKEKDFYQHVKGLIAEAKESYAQRYANGRGLDAATQAERVKEGELNFQKLFQDFMKFQRDGLRRRMGADAAEAYLNRFQAWQAAMGTEIFDLSKVPEMDLPDSVEFEGRQIALEGIEKTLRNIIANRELSFRIESEPQPKPRPSGKNVVDFSAAQKTREAKRYIS